MSMGEPMGNGTGICPHCGAPALYNGRAVLMGYARKFVDHVSPCGAVCQQGMSLSESGPRFGHYHPKDCQCVARGTLPTKPIDYYSDGDFGEPLRDPMDVVEEEIEASEAKRRRTVIPREASVSPTEVDARARLMLLKILGAGNRGRIAYGMDVGPDSERYTIDLDRGEVYRRR